MGNIARVVKGALSRRQEVQVRLSDRVTATLYDRPGLWMDDAELAALRGEVRGVAAAAIPGALDYGVFLPARAPWENRLVVVGRTAEGETVGFNAMPRLAVRAGGRKVEVLHLGLLVIHPKFQRQGWQGLLYGLGAFSLLRRIRERPVWISNVTEVPAVFGAVAGQFLDVYPHPQRTPPPPALHREIALAIMAQHRHEFGVGEEARFDAGRFVIEGGYTGGSDALKKTFASAPRHRDPAVNAFCERELDYGRGDDFLQIGQLDGAVIANWLTRRVPEALRPQAARQLAPWSYPA